MLSVDLDVSKLWIEKFDDVFQDIMEHRHTFRFYLSQTRIVMPFVTGNSVTL